MGWSGLSKARNPVVLGGTLGLIASLGVVGLAPSGISSAADVTLQLDKNWTSAVAANTTSTIEVADAVYDDFESGGYSGGAGWSTNWDEDGDDNNATQGTIEVLDQNELEFDDIDGDDLEREADLSGFSSATLSLTFVDGDVDGSAESLNFLFYNGTTFQSVGTVSASSSDLTRFSFALDTSMLRSDGELRIAGGDTNWQSGDEIRIDDIVISGPAVSGTATASGSNPELDANVVSTTVSTGDVLSITETMSASPTTLGAELQCTANGSTVDVPVVATGDVRSAIYTVPANATGTVVCTFANANSLPNPDLSPACGINVEMILDESGSINTFGGTTAVRDAVLAFNQGLLNTDSKLRLSEFSTDARDVILGSDASSIFRDVDATLTTDLNTYFGSIDPTGTPPAGDNDTYNPTDNSPDGQNWTNWEAGLSRGRPGEAPLVLFITDGVPNTVGTAGTSVGGTRSGQSDAAANAAIEEMNALKASGAHILGIAVGQGITSATNLARLENLIEPGGAQTYTGGGGLDLRTTDVISVASFSDLDNALREVVYALCAPSLSITKLDQSGNPVGSWSFTTTVEVDDPGTGATETDAYEWKAPVTGMASAVGITQTDTTAANTATGTTLFQWVPGSEANPEPWDSRARFTETLPPNWTLNSTHPSFGCTVERLNDQGGIDNPPVTLAFTGPDAAGVVSFTLRDAQGAEFVIDKADLVKCTVVNNRPVTVVVEKTLVPASDTGRFDLRINGSTEATNVGDGGSGSTEVAVGTTVNVDELGNNTALGDYTSQLDCGNVPVSQNTGTSGTFVAPPDGGGTTVTCTFTNTRKGANLVVDKTWVGADVNDAVSISIDGINDDTGASVADTANETDASVASTAVFAGETVQLAETFTTGSAADYDTTLTCSYGAAQPVDVPVTNNSIVVPAAAANSTIRCVFTNTRKPEPLFGVVKSVVAAPTQPVLVAPGSFQYTVDYTVTVSNTGTGAGTYTLDDALSFGTGTSLDAIALVGTVPASANPAFGLGDLAIVKTAAPLAAGASETFTVRATFTVAGSMTSTQRDCTLDQGETGTGTLNSATVTPNFGNPVTDDACAPIPDPNITVTKTLTSGPDYRSATSDYTVSYDVVVSNAGGGPGTYTLVDTPMFGGGTNITKVEVDSTDPVVDLEQANGTPITIVTNSPIASGATKTFVVTVTFTVDATATSDQRNCTLTTGETGTGTLNKVTVTPNIGPSDDGQDCGPIPNPGIGVVKNVVASPSQPVQVAPGSFQYTVDYTVTVSNTGTAGGTYTLVDAPAFGAGTTLDSIQLIAPIPTSANGSFGTSDLAIVKTPAPLAPGASEVFTVRATFTAAGSMTTTDRDCTLGAGENGTGTYNVATVTPSLGEPSSDNACAPIPDPNVVVTKTLASGPTPTAPGSLSWTVTYTIEAQNNGAGPAVYDLTDVPTFASGVTITAREATSGDLTVNGDFNSNLASPTIATGVPIAAGEKDVVNVVVTFDYAGSVSPTDLECGQTPEPGKGTYNAATVTPNIGEPSTDDACGPLPPGNVTVDKRVSSPPVNNGNGTFTVQYAIDVVNAAGAGTAIYDLDDVSTFSQGVSITSESVTNSVPGGITTDPTFPTSGTIVTGQSIAGGATHTYLVNVTVSVAFTTTTTYVPCSSTTGTAGEGLFNRATLTVNGDETNDDVCPDLPGDLQIEKTDGGITTEPGGAPFPYTLTITNVGGTSTGAPVIVTDVLPAEFEWVSFPTGATLPTCTQAAQVLTCELDPTTVDQGGESTTLVLTAQARPGTAANATGYENLSYVDSPEDPAPSTPSCVPNARLKIEVEAVVDAVLARVIGQQRGVPTNNVACDVTPVVLPPTTVPPTTAPPTTAPPTTVPPTTAPPTTVPVTTPPPATTVPPQVAPPTAPATLAPATVPPEGLPATGANSLSTILWSAALALGVGLAVVLAARRRRGAGTH